MKQETCPLLWETLNMTRFDMSTVIMNFLIVIPYNSIYHCADVFLTRPQRKADVPKARPTLNQSGLATFGFELVNTDLDPTGKDNMSS